MDRVLVSGYCPHGVSGYGLQTNKLIRYLSEKYTVGVIFWDIVDRNECYSTTFSDFTKTSDQFKDKIVNHDCALYIPRRPLSNYSNYYWEDMKWACDEFEPKFIITIHDIWTIPTIGKEILVPMYAWLPIHYDPPEKNTIANLQHFEAIWSTSLWGKGVLAEYHNDVRHVPHFIDDVYFDGVLSNISRRNDIRSRMGIGERAYVFLMVARNTEKSNRKGFNIALNAFTVYKKTKNPLAHLHLHVNINGAIDIQKMAIDLDIGQSVSCSNQETFGNYAFSPEYVRDMYLMSDALLCTSAAEGFGLPIVEAQCCGLPVIATHCTGISENVLMGRLSDPVKQLTGNIGSFSLPCHENVTLDMVELERDKPTQMTKNNVRMTMKGIFGDVVVSRSIISNIGSVRTRVIVNRPHILDVYKTTCDIVAHDMYTGYNGNTIYKMHDFKTFEATGETLDYEVVHTNRNIHMTSDGIMEDGVLRISFDRNTKYGLGKVGGDDVYIKFEMFPRVTTYSVSDGEEHSFMLPPVEGLVDKDNILVHNSLVYVPVNNLRHIAWIFDLDKNTQQRIEIVNAFHATCFIEHENGYYIYGNLNEESIVKKITYEDLSIATD
jgi:glycosyltransferase involved in cell wall biosynthesis